MQGIMVALMLCATTFYHGTNDADAGDWGERHLSKNVLLHQLVSCFAGYDAPLDHATLHHP